MFERYQWTVQKLGLPLPTGKEGCNCLPQILRYSVAQNYNKQYNILFSVLFFRTIHVLFRLHTEIWILEVSSINLYICFALYFFIFSCLLFSYFHRVSNIADYSGISKFRCRVSIYSYLCFQIY